MKQYTVAPLKDHLDSLVEANFERGAVVQSREFEDVMSHREIIKAKAYLERQNLSDDDNPPNNHHS
jgi:hypothetical protein